MCILSKIKQYIIPCVLSPFIIHSFISCKAGTDFFFSNQVKVQWVEPHTFTERPTAYISDQENLICRRGVPSNNFPPWELNQELNEGDGAADAEIADRIVVSATGNWFRVSPLIHNNTPLYLVISRIEFRLRGERNRELTSEKVFSDGYCETNYLYLLPSRITLNKQDVNKMFHIGNLIFYVDGLPALPEDTRSTGYRPTRLIEYFVDWIMYGSFHDASDSEGIIKAQFEKKGSIRTKKVPR